MDAWMTRGYPRRRSPLPRSGEIMGHRPRPRHLALLVILTAACVSRPMSGHEHDSLGPDEGFVLGSVRIEGGRDILGRSGWSLRARRFEWRTGFEMDGYEEDRSESYAVDTEREAGEK